VEEKLMQIHESYAIKMNNERFMIIEQENSGTLLGCTTSDIGRASTYEIEEALATAKAIRDGRKLDVWAYGEVHKEVFELYMQPGEDEGLTPIGIVKVQIRECESIAI
jgi:hypothetical protein